jgi:polysaccharide biosynthesis/export protein
MKQALKGDHMKSVRFRNLKDVWQHVLPAALLIVGLVGIWGSGTVPAFAQSPRPEAEKEAPPEEPKAAKPARDRSGVEKKAISEERVITPEERVTLRREDSSEAEAAVLPYINNFFATTRLGPEDMISVDVFDQPVYSRGNIIVPPNGRINYPLIGRVDIVGRTTDEIEKEITEKLAEYIIDPKVTVQINQVHSLKFLVVGDVGAPGVYDMTRRMTLSEGLAKAGYVNKYGKKSNVSILRLQADGQPMPIKVNLKDVEKGKTRDVYLAPGDTVVVPGNILKTVESVLSIVSLAWWMRAVVDW